MKREYKFYVYILASLTLRFYIGLTNDLHRRVREHKTAEDDSFTARYNINRLVFFEEFKYFDNAERRETELKGWTRQKKIALIKSMNPTWQDLSEGWYGELELKVAMQAAKERKGLRAKRVTAGK